MSSPAPSALTSATLMALLSSLSLPSPAAEELVLLHAPFVHPSSLPHGQLNKWLTRLNSAVTSRDPAAAQIASAVIEQDTEGYAAAQYGKPWMGACLGVLGAPTTSPELLPAFSKLTRSLIAAAPHAPAFEREVVQPAMGKLAVSMSRMLERLVEGGYWSAMDDALDATRALLVASPPPFRPAAPALRTVLNSVVLGLSPAPENVRFTAAQTLAVVHMTGGKAAAPAAWGTDMRETLGGLAASLTAMTAEAWEEEPPRATPPPPPSSLPAFSIDPIERVAASLTAVEGYTEIALAMLSTTSARPVPIPLAQIVSASLRCLNLTFDTPVAAHVSPQHHAALVAALPRIWKSGLLLLASAMVACGDHVVPHLSAILEHTVYLLERVPSTMADARLKLFQFHSILLNVYPAAILPVEYTTRLLKFSLGVMGNLLDARPQAASAPAAQQGRKNKKRARGQEDALVGGLEGRAPRATSQIDADIVRVALDLSPQLHSAPLLPPALLTFSIRLHLSLYAALASRPSGFVDVSSGVAVRDALERALEHAATLESGGTARDVRTLLIAFLPSTKDRNAHFDLLLHPALPPLARPLPPLSQLHMFAPESEEERRIRREMGFKNPGEDDADESDDEGEEDAMAVDDWAPPARNGSAKVPVAAPAPVPAPAPIAAAPVAVAVAAVPVAPVQPAQPPVPAAPVAATTAPFAASAPAPASAVDGGESAPAVPFMSAPTSRATSAPSEPSAAPAVPAPAPAGTTAEDDDDSDDEIPELDSGSSDEDE